MTRQNDSRMVLILALQLFIALGALNASKECKHPIDIGFLIDASNHIEKRQFGTVKKGIKKLLDAFEVSKTGAHVSAVSFSDDAKVAFNFNTLQGDEYATENVARLINSISLVNRSPRIDVALQKANYLFRIKTGMRKKATKILFVITDAYQTSDMKFLTIEDLEKASAPLKKKGVHIYSIAIGNNFDIINLITIAHDDSSLFHPWSENAWGNIAEAVIEQHCKAKVGLEE